jgi:hypothetical protein
MRENLLTLSLEVDESYETGHKSVMALALFGKSNSKIRE